jgi:hypothetical protein
MALELKKFLEALNRNPDIPENERQFLGGQLKQTDGYLHDVEGKNRERRLEEMLKRYGSETHTVDLVSRTWDANWNAWKHRTGTSVDICVHEPDLSDKEVGEIQDSGNMLVFVPESVSTPESWRDLVRGFCPGGLDVKTKRSFLGSEPERYKNAKNQKGWMVTRCSVDAPIAPESTEIVGIRKQLSDEGLQGMNLNTYLIATSFAQKNGIVFDEAQGWAFISRRVALPETVSKDDETVYLCATSQVVSKLSVHIEESALLEESDRRRLRLRAVRPVRSFVQKRLF